MKWSRSVVSDFLLPHGLELTRLLHPWNFSGKSTGVGCHFLLQGAFPTQRSNLDLLHCRQTLYHLGLLFADLVIKRTATFWIITRCRCQPAKSIRSRERARHSWERKLQQKNSTTKMGSRGSDMSPPRDAVWPRLYSASYIYTGEREKDKTVVACVNSLFPFIVG